MRETLYKLSNSIQRFGKKASIVSVGALALTSILGRPQGFSASVLATKASLTTLFTGFVGKKIVGGSEKSNIKKLPGINTNQVAKAA